MNSSEFPSNYELDAIEQQTAAAVAADNATLGESDESVELDFCKDCPMLGFPQEEIASTSHGIRWSVRHPGITAVTMSILSRNGKRSKEMLLGIHNSNSIGGRRINKIYSDAARRTKECEKPRRTPPFLGPLAVKKCRAIERY